MIGTILSMPRSHCVQIKYQAQKVKIHVFIACTRMTRSAKALNVGPSAPVEGTRCQRTCMDKLLDR